MLSATGVETLTRRETGTELSDFGDREIVRLVLSQRKRGEESPLAVCEANTGETPEDELRFYKGWQVPSLGYFLPFRAIVWTQASTETSTRISRPAARQGGRSVSLREAWELAGRVLEEAQTRRQQAREKEAAIFLLLPGTSG